MLDAMLPGAVGHVRDGIPSAIRGFGNLLPFALEKTVSPGFHVCNQLSRERKFVSLSGAPMGARIS
jgi:hypothetical protein